MKRIGVLALQGAELRRLQAGDIDSLIVAGEPRVGEVQPRQVSRSCLRRRGFRRAQLRRLVVGGG